MLSSLRSSTALSPVPTVPKCAHCAQCAHMCPHVPSVRQAGVKLAVVSDGNAALAHAQFRELGWGGELFEVIVGADAGVRGPCGVWRAAGNTWRVRGCGR